MKIAIVGAGMAGLACAEALGAKSHVVALFDKGTRPGGRMSTRRVRTALGEASFDHGAQYFSARDPAFRTRVDRWAADGIVARWPAAGHDAWVGVPGMSAPIAALAGDRDVRWSSRVEALIRHEAGWRMSGQGAAETQETFDAVIVAVPAEQVPLLVKPFDAAMAMRAEATPSQPCWTVMAAFATRLPVEADVVKDTAPIGWAARNSAKPGRAGPEAWVIQADATWSAAHLEDEPEDVAAALLQAFADHLRIERPETVSLTAHRWRYAKAGRAGARFLWNETLKLGACGDWLVAPKVEGAWVSGTALALTIEKA